MGLPFIITEGTSLIVDTNGNIAGIVPALAGYNRFAVDGTIRSGRDFGGGFLNADVVLKNERHALVTDAFVTVEQVFGFDDFADSWFFIDDAGAIGDTITIHIDGFIDTTGGGERTVPTIDHTVTVTALEAGNEVELRDLIIAELNALLDFSEFWKASSIKDNAAVHVGSKKIGEYGDRLGFNAFNITTTGSIIWHFQDSDNNIMKRRGKQNSGARDPRDKRLVTIGISGEVQAVPGAAGDIFIQNVTDDGLPTGSADLRVNGSNTPQLFYIDPNDEKDLFITELRFYGGGNGIQYDNFISQNGKLDEGIKVEIRSDEEILTFPLIKSTEDFKNKWAFGSGANFKMETPAGTDQFLAVLNFDNPFPLRKLGTFQTGDDFIHVTIQDGLQSGLTELECLAVGFLREV